MGRYELEYPKEAFSTVKRLDNRANYALRTIHRIINSSQFLHVSFNVPDSPFPMLLPMIGQMGSFARPSADEGSVLDLYLHGYVSSRLMKVARDGHGGDHPADLGGMPLSVAASHVDGLVLALTPNSHSYNYRSAVLFGRAVAVTDVAEKLYAMELITESVARGRWANSRLPPNAAEMQSTTILRVKIQTGSAKIRAGEPHDEKHDSQDEDLCRRVWTGVVPVHLTLGDPIPGPDNRLDELPAYLADFIQDFKDTAKETALLGAVEPEKKTSKHSDG